PRRRASRLRRGRPLGLPAAGGRPGRPPCGRGGGGRGDRGLLLAALSDAAQLHDRGGLDPGPDRRRARAPVGDRARPARGGRAAGARARVLAPHARIGPPARRGARPLPSLPHARRGTLLLEAAHAGRSLVRVRALAASAALAALIVGGCGGGGGAGTARHAATARSGRRAPAPRPFKPLAVPAHPAPRTVRVPILT